MMSTIFGYLRMSQELVRQLSVQYLLTMHAALGSISVLMQNNNTNNSK